MTNTRDGLLIKSIFLYILFSIIYSYFFLIFGCKIINVNSCVETNTIVSWVGYYTNSAPGDMPRVTLTVLIF